ncbi:hypothetical protein [Allocoleopsis sp.]
MASQPSQKASSLQHWRLFGGELQLMMSNPMPRFGRMSIGLP